MNIVKQPLETDAKNEVGVPQIEITRDMIEAGAARLDDLIRLGADSTYVAEEVFLAMAAVSPGLASRRTAS